MCISKMFLLHFRVAMLCLACLAALLLAPTIQAAPPSGLTVYSPMSFEKNENHPTCIGEMKFITVMVDEKPRPSVMGIYGASVTVNGTYYATTGYGGGVGINYKVTEEGKITLNISATKPGYDPAAPIQVTVYGQKCGWNIRMQYTEVVTNKKGAPWNVIFTFRFPNQPFIANEDGSLALVGSSKIEADYSATVDNLTEVYTLALIPTINGKADVFLSGTYDKKTGSLIITLKATPLGLAAGNEVKVHQIAALDPNMIIPDVPWGLQPQADVIKAANITDWQASPGFDYKIFDPKTSLIINDVGGAAKMMYAHGVIEIERRKNVNQ